VRPPYAVTAVQYGSVALPKRELFHRFELYREPDAPFEMAYFLWVVTGDDGESIVIDTGFDRHVGERRGRTGTGSPADALRALELEPASVETVVLTHLHFDHTGNVPAFANAKLVVSRAEINFWTGPMATRPQFATHVEASEIANVAARSALGGVLEVASRHELAPGITLHPVGGHSPGQQIVVIEDAFGSVVLASDAVHFYEELALDRVFSIFTNLAEVYAAYDIISEHESRGAVVVPGHDPDVSRIFRQRFSEDGVCAVDVRSPQRPS
jgi:glyoxylase-like metal-dependent hydrolase (beta-lactamase superfamily II)